MGILEINWVGATSCQQPVGSWRSSRPPRNTSTDSLVNAFKEGFNDVLRSSRMYVMIT